MYICVLFIELLDKGALQRPAQGEIRRQHFRSEYIVRVCLFWCVHRRETKREREMYAYLYIYIHTCSTCIYMPTPIHMHMQETKEAFTKARETLLHRATLQNSTIAYTAGFWVSFDCGYAQHQHTGTCSILNRKIVHWN